MNIYLKQKLFAIGDKYDFTDIDQKIIFQAKKSALSMTKIFMYDPNGQELFLIKKKLFVMMPQYSVLKEGKEVLFLKRKFGIRPKFDVTDADGNTYAIMGDYMAHDFQLIKNDKFMGSIRKKYFSFGDAYELSVDDEYDPALFCCFALALDNCLHNENNKR